MATAIEVITALLTLGGLVYLLLALWGARAFAHFWRGRVSSEFAPDVTILKPVKGVDPRMYAGFVSHCRQVYAGRFEILFGVSSLDDPAVGEIERLKVEFPAVAIRLVVCTERLGTSGKVSNLVQMLAAGTFEHVLINDSDIAVTPRYLATVMGCFEEETVGLVTAPYLGKTAERGRGLTVWAKLEALGISTDFLPGVLTARTLEGGLRFGLGSTLAMTRTALEKAGGMEALVEYLADDYEMGARIAAAGYRVELCPEVVETSVPGYDLRGYCVHQIRWARSTRDSRKLGYLGLGVTYAVPWALATMVASGFALWSFTLLSLVLLARVAVALSVGVGLLRDGQVLRDLWLLPLRDLTGLMFWAWSFAGDTVVWRGEVFRLQDGRLEKV
ncbi:bacteriohopanetetrol glucosamine biosynthesis glycosyltransferase HpnI [Granulicella sibirica]|uniref:Putative ceramide glucosyltransferase n=1 Tax=Granulicella sibirica TaxID=2479048 RepID=A0A4Q0TA20_9BACT|nr:bacteriohopanetetrol glucosamine biosynthesis glycosyltransferase HpnI [Granulicella sibirica]RXH58481.1 putative ceramide glucosyltransferase [Granulicella sibirica]